ncbi:hypothetical protein CALVIDRAFT_567841 [Calocera viscosa TUFC12733]|uniref:FHA domain-containing protein n=1 Tax=Calocera viscosa (strain TUFC12733) TaxID=1330018 RepID=A0A167HTB9_CALVF|nr:hypothetical protein CALVIDRAFT_567841 [Calocera viscosa TUFC12733]
MRSTIGLAAPEPDARRWSFPRLGTMGRGFYDWEQPFQPATSDILDDAGPVGQAQEPLHPGIRLRTLPPYPPQSVYDLVPTNEKTVFILGRHRIEHDVNRSRSDGSSDGSEGEPEVVNMHSRVVSKRHARIEFIGQEVYITDLESTHGTWVLRDGSTDQFLGNDVPFALKDGDEIRIGRRVHGYPAVHLIIETIGTPRSTAPATSGSPRAPVTPDIGRMPLSPPPSRRRSTNSFRAPDFSDMDISRSPSPSPIPVLPSSFVPGLQSPIVLDYTPSPPISHDNSPIQSAPDLPAFMSSLHEEPNRWVTYASSPARSEELEDPEVLAVPPREPRPYEFIMTPSILGSFTVVETRLSSPPIVSEAQADLVEPDILASDAVRSPSPHDLHSAPFSDLQAAGSPSLSMSVAYQTPGGGVPTAATILVPETTSPLQCLNPSFDDVFARLVQEAPAEAMSENMLPSEVPGTISESSVDLRVEHDQLAAENAEDDASESVVAAESVDVNKVESAPANVMPIGQGHDERVREAEIDGQPADNASTDINNQLQRLNTVLTEIRNLDTAQKVDCNEKWVTVNRLMEELRKGANQPPSGAVEVLSNEARETSRKRKREDTDEEVDHDRSTETNSAGMPLINTAGHIEMGAAQDVYLAGLSPRPTKRRRSLATSRTTLAFVAGGAAVWLALGMDYGL